MTQFLRILCGLMFAALVTACGGGGGSPGTTTGGTGGGGIGTGTTPSATITLDLVTSAGTVTTTVGSDVPVFARATVRDAGGVPVAGQVVTFSAESSLVRFVPQSGTALTGSNGVALVQIMPESADSAGAGTLKADATVAGKEITQSLSFQVPQGVSNAATSRVANFVMLLDRSTLSNGGTATAKLTIVAVDVNNNVVPGATVSVSTDANTVFTPGSSATDAQGQYTGTISSTVDKTDRQVVVTATINGLVKQTALQITGSQIELTATPTIFTPSANASLTARLLDAASSPIAGKTVTFSGDIPALAGRTATTDVNGNATVTFLAPATVGSYIVRAAASGIISALSVQVGSSALIPSAQIPAGALPSLSAIPNVVSPNTTGIPANQSQLRFLFLDPQNRPIPNVRVRFEIASSGLGSFDSSISTGTSTVFTNASGVASAVFIPGPTGSPTDGVEVRACYQATDFASTSTCASSVAVRLTIAAQALAVSIGNDNLLTAGPGTYIKQFAVTVADAAGRAVPNALVDISLDITHYGKGSFDAPITFPLNVAEANSYKPLDASTVPVSSGTTTFRVSCINEDFNRNGSVDANENVNNSFDSFGQPTLEPRRSDIILSYVDPLVRTTNASGILLIKVEYSQRFATWLAYRIRATTSVAGSQGSAERAFVTSFIVDDLPTGSFLTPPYGSSACNNPN